MTKYEKLALEMTAGLMNAVAALAVANGAKSELLSVNLPNLTPEQRQELQEDSEVQIANAQQLKNAAANLKLILENN